MSVRDRVSTHLPALRRYSRALTGSQKSGDAYVRAALEALLAGEAALDDALEPKVALHKLFHAVWCASAERLDRAEVGAIASGASPEQRLRGLSPLAREALLLGALEGFNASQVAQVLGVTTAEADELALAAQQEIDAELATDVLVIEDEALIAEDIRELTEELGHRVYAVARTRDEAVTAARAHAPGLVLADIQLADQSSGIDAVNDILGTFDAPIIFVTAFPERLLTGEKPEPAYLMTKPFDRLALKATIGQALFFHRRRVAA